MAEMTEKEVKELLDKMPTVHIDMEKVEEKVQIAKNMLVLSNPFFASLLFQLDVKPSLAYGPTAATDGRHIYYNPVFFDSLNKSELRAVICHEILHCVFEHQLRRGDRDHMKWNIATDYAINQILKSDNQFDLPVDVLYDKKYEGMDAYEIYDLLPEEDDGPNGTGGGGSEGDKDQNNNGESESNSDPGKMGGVVDADSADTDKQSEDWKKNVIKAHKIAKIHGDCPAYVERIVKDLLEPTVDWRNVLRRYLEEIFKSDYTFTRPNYRYAHTGFNLPSLHNTEGGRIVIAVDTSGSISDTVLSQFGGEIEDIMRQYNLEGYLIYCDMDINGEPEEIIRGDQRVNIEARGGGGTDFRPVFNWIEENAYDPSVVVYLTDLFGPMPDEAPGYPVIWACTSNEKPAWGNLVEVKIGEKNNAI